MSDLQELLEVLAESGDARGAGLVLERATERASQHRRARRRRRVVSVLGAAVAIVVAVAVIAQTSSTGHGDTHVGVGGSTTSTAAPTTSTTVASATVAQLAAGHWSTIPPAPIEPRYDASVVWTGKELLVWGGEVQPGHSGPGLYGDGAAYDPTPRTWRRLPPAPLVPRFGQVSVWTGTEMVIWTGARPSSDGQPAPAANDAAAAYNPATNKWRKASAVPLSAGPGGAGVWTGDRVLLLSGDRAASYDPATDLWRRLPSPTPTHRPLAWAFLAAAGPGRVFAWSESYGLKQVGPGRYEGYGGTDLFRYDESSNRWTPLSAGPDAIDGPGEAFWIHGRLLVRGGLPPMAMYTGPGSPEKEAWFDLPAGRATRIEFDDSHGNGAPSGVSVSTGDALASFDLNQGATAIAHDPNKRGSSRPLPRGPFGCGPASVWWTGTSVLIYCSVPSSARFQPTGGLEYVVRTG